MIERKRLISLFSVVALVFSGSTTTGIAISHAQETTAGLPVVYDCVNDTNVLTSGCGFSGEQATVTSTDLTIAGLETAINTQDRDEVLKVMQLELKNGDQVLPIESATLANGVVTVVPAAGLGLANATYSFPASSSEVSLHARVLQIASKTQSTVLQFQVGEAGSTTTNTKFAGVGMEQTATGAQAYVAKGGSYEFVYEGEPGTYPETTTGTLTRVRVSQAYPGKVHEIYRWDLATAADAAQAVVTVGKATTQTVELVVPYRDDVVFFDQTSATPYPDTKEGTGLAITERKNSGTGQRYLKAQASDGNFDFTINSTLESLESVPRYSGSFNYFIRGLEARDGEVNPAQHTDNDMDNAQITAFVKEMMQAHGDNNANGWNFGMAEYEPWSQKATATEGAYKAWLTIVKKTLEKSYTQTIATGPLAGVTVTATYSDIKPADGTLASAVSSDTASSVNPSNALGNKLIYTLKVNLRGVTRPKTTVMLDLFKNERRAPLGGSNTTNEVYLANLGSIGTEAVLYSGCLEGGSRQHDSWVCPLGKGGIGFQDLNSTSWFDGIDGNGWRGKPVGGSGGGFSNESPIERDGYGTKFLQAIPGFELLAGGAGTSYPMRTSSHNIRPGTVGRVGPNSISSLYFRVQDGFGGYVNDNREQRVPANVEYVRPHVDDYKRVDQGTTQYNFEDVPDNRKFVRGDNSNQVYVEAEVLDGIFKYDQPDYASDTDSAKAYANSRYATVAVKIPEAQMPYSMAGGVIGTAQPYSNPFISVSGQHVPVNPEVGRFQYWELHYQDVGNTARIAPVRLSPAKPIVSYDEAIAATLGDAALGGARKYTTGRGQATATNINLVPVFEQTRLNLVPYTLSQQKASDASVKEDLTFYGLPGVTVTLAKAPYQDKTLADTAYTRAADDHATNVVTLTSANAEPVVLKYDKTDPPTITKLVRRGNGGVEIMFDPATINPATTTLVCKYVDDQGEHTATTALTVGSAGTPQVTFTEPVPDGATFTCTQTAHGITSGESKSLSLPLPQKVAGTTSLDSIDRTDPAQPVLGGTVTVPSPQPENTTRPAAVEVYDGDRYVGTATVDPTTGKWSLPVAAAVADSANLQLVPVNNTDPEQVTARGEATSNPDRPAAPSVGTPTVNKDGQVTVPVTPPANYQEGDQLECRLVGGESWAGAVTVSNNQAVFPAAAQGQQVECRTVRGDLESAATTPVTAPEQAAAPTAAQATRTGDNVHLEVADPGAGTAPYALLPKAGAPGETVAVPLVQDPATGKYVLDLANPPAGQDLSQVDVAAAKALTNIPVYTEDEAGNQSAVTQVAVPAAVAATPTITGINQDTGTLAVAHAPANGFVQLLDETGQVVATVPTGSDGTANFVAGQGDVPAGAFAAGKQYTVRAVNKAAPDQVTAAGPASAAVTVPAAPSVGTPTVTKDGQVVVPVTRAAGDTSTSTFVCRVAGAADWTAAVTVTDGQAVLPATAQGQQIECRAEAGTIHSPSATSAAAPTQTAAPAAGAVRNGDELVLSVPAGEVPQGATPYVELPVAGQPGKTVAVPLVPDPETGEYVLALDQPAAGQDLTGVDVAAAKQAATLPVYTKDAAGNESAVRQVAIPAALPQVTGTATVSPDQGVQVTVPAAEFAQAAGNNVVISYVDTSGTSQQVVVPAADQPVSLPNADPAQPVTITVVDGANSSAPSPVAVPRPITTSPSVSALTLDKTAGANPQATARATVSGTPGQVVQLLDADGAVLGAATVSPAGTAVFTGLTAAQVAQGVSTRYVNDAEQPTSFGPNSATVQPPAAPTLNDVLVNRKSDGSLAVAPAAALPQGLVRECRLVGQTTFVALPHDFTGGDGSQLECRDVITAASGSRVTSAVSDPIPTADQLPPVTGAQATVSAGAVELAADEPAAGVTVYALVPSKTDPNQLIEVPLTPTGTGKVTVTAAAADQLGADLNALAGGPVTLVARSNNSASAPAQTSVPQATTGTGQITRITRTGEQAGISGTYTGNAPYVTVTVGDKQVTVPVQNGRFHVPLGAGENEVSASDLAAQTPVSVTGVNSATDPTSTGTPSAPVAIPAAPEVTKQIDLADGSTQLTLPAPAAGETLRCRIPGGSWVPVAASGQVTLPGGAGQDISCQRVVAGMESPVAEVSAQQPLPQISAIGTRIASGNPDAPDQVTVTVPAADFAAAAAANAAVKVRFVDQAGQQQEIVIPAERADEPVTLPAADPTYPVYAFAADPAGNEAPRTQVVLPKAITDTPAITAVTTTGAAAAVSGQVEFTPIVKDGSSEPVNERPSFVSIQDSAGQVLAVVPVSYGTGAAANQGTFAAPLADYPQLQEYLAAQDAAGLPAALQVVGQNAATSPTAVGPDAPARFVPTAPQVGTPKWTATGEVVVPVLSSNETDQVRCRAAGSQDEFVLASHGQVQLAGLSAGDRVECQVANAQGAWQSVTATSAPLAAQPEPAAAQVTFLPATTATPATQVVTVPAAVADRVYATYVDENGQKQQVELTSAGAATAAETTGRIGASLPAGARDVQVVVVADGNETAAPVPATITAPVTNLVVAQSGQGDASQVTISGQVDPGTANAVAVTTASGEQLIVPVAADGSFTVPADRLAAADFTAGATVSVRPVSAELSGATPVISSYGPQSTSTIPAVPEQLNQVARHDGSVAVTGAAGLRCRVPGGQWQSGEQPLILAEAAGQLLECQQVVAGIASPVVSVPAAANLAAPTPQVTRDPQQVVVSVPATAHLTGATLLLADGSQVPLTVNPATGQFAAQLPATTDLAGATVFTGDAAGNESVPVPVVAPHAITTAPVVTVAEQADDQVLLAGTAAPGTAFVQLVVAGEVIASVPVAQDGSWQAPAVTKELAQQLAVRGANAPTNPTVIGPAATLPAAPELQDLGAGRAPGAAEVRLTYQTPAGEREVEVPVAADGTFAAELPDLLPGSEVTAVAKDAAGNVSLPAVQLAPVPEPEVTLSGTDAGEISGQAGAAEAVTITFFDATAQQVTVTAPVAAGHYEQHLEQTPFPGSPVFVRAVKGDQASAPVVKLLPVKITEFTAPTPAEPGVLQGLAVTGAEIEIAYESIDGTIKRFKVTAENNSFSAQIPVDAKPGTLVSAVVIAYQGQAYENSAAAQVQVPQLEAEPSSPSAPTAAPVPPAGDEPQIGSAERTGEHLRCVLDDDLNRKAAGLVAVLAAISGLIWLGGKVNLPQLSLPEVALPPAPGSGENSLPDLVGEIQLPHLPQVAVPEQLVAQAQAAGQRLAPFGVAGAILFLLAHNAQECFAVSS